MGMVGDTVMSPLNSSHLMLELEMIMALLVSLHEISKVSLVGIVFPKLFANKSE